MRLRFATLFVAPLLVAVNVACGGRATGPQPTVTPATPTAPQAAPVLPATPPPTAAVSPAAFKPPADHVKDRKGAMHKKGSKEAMVNCVECHGVNLRGGKGPSCYTCHEKEWK